MTSKLFSACYTWGRHTGLKLRSSRPSMISRGLEEISDMSFGINHCAIVTKSGSLFTYGVNNFNRLTHPSSTFPIEVAINPIKQVQCGDHSTIALGVKGELYSWGSTGTRSMWSHITGGRHSLGIDTDKNILAPTDIRVPEEIIEISCGRQHCLALGKHNVYTWGINDFGQLGEGLIFSHYATPKPISSLSKLNEIIVKVAAAEFSSAALTSTGKVYVWGSNKECQLGLGKDTLVVTEPTLLPISEIYPIKDLYVGGSSMMLLSETDEVFVSGLHMWKKFLKFELPNGLQPSKLCCGDDYFAVLCKDGEVAYYGGIFSSNPLLVDLPDKVDVMEQGFVPGKIQRMEGKYGYMGVISLIDLNDS